MKIATKNNDGAVATTGVVRDENGRIKPGSKQLYKPTPKEKGRRRDKALQLRDMLLKELVEGGKGMEALQKCIHKQPAAVLNLMSKLIPTNVEHTHKVLPAPVIVDGAGVVTNVETLPDAPAASLLHDEEFIG